ncbi:MAG: hypothetical protein ACK5DG_04595 [Chitinophagaceae bacterium]|jgi:hypothetical protein
MKYKLIIILFCLTMCLHTAAQQQSKKVEAGIELDVLPYATGGWFAAAWAGKYQWRMRVLTASVNKPNFTTKTGFTNHHINAYAVLADRFLKKGWKVWWLGGGIVLWNSSIQTDAKLQTAKFTNFLLNGSAGYNITLHKKIYLSPWAGLSMRVSGSTNVAVDNKLYTLPFFNPEASLKFGIWF